MRGLVPTGHECVVGPARAGRSPAWRSSCAAGAPADALAITRLVPRRDNRRDRDVAKALVRSVHGRAMNAIVGRDLVLADCRAGLMGWRLAFCMGNLVVRGLSPPGQQREDVVRRARCRLTPDAAVRAVWARLLLLRLLCRSLWLAGRAAVRSAPPSAASPGRRGSCGRVGGRGCWRSNSTATSMRRGPSCSSDASIIRHAQSSSRAAVCGTAIGPSPASALVAEQAMRSRSPSAARLQFLGLVASPESGSGATSEEPSSNRAWPTPAGRLTRVTSVRRAGWLHLVERAKLALGGLCSAEPRLGEPWPPLGRAGEDRLCAAGG